MVSSDAQSFVTGWLKHIGQPVTTVPDSLLNLCKHTPLLSEKKALEGRRVG